MNEEPSNWLEYVCVCERKSKEHRCKVKSSLGLKLVWKNTRSVENKTVEMKEREWPQIWCWCG